MMSAMIIGFVALVASASACTNGLVSEEKIEALEPQKAKDFATWALFWIPHLPVLALPSAQQYTDTARTYAHT